jgi:hypothetical protein
MQDPLANLNIDTNDVDTSMPCILDKKVGATITEATIEQNKRGNGFNLVVKFSTSTVAEGSAGPINPGYPLRKYYPLQQSENPKAPDFRRDIALLIDAVFQPESPASRPPLNTETVNDMIGKEVILKLKIEESDEYGAQNSVTGVIAA